MNPRSGVASDADDRGARLYCSSQTCGPFVVLLKSLCPLPIAGVLRVCVRRRPDDRRPQGAAARVREDRQANVSKGLAWGCASLTEVPAVNQGILHQVLCPQKVKAGFPAATQCPHVGRLGQGRR